VLLTLVIAQKADPRQFGVYAEAVAFAALLSVFLVAGSDAAMKWAGAHLAGPDRSRLELQSCRRLVRNILLALGPAFLIFWWGHHEDASTRAGLFAAVCLYALAFSLDLITGLGYQIENRIGRLAAGVTGKFLLLGLAWFILPDRLHAATALLAAALVIVPTGILRMSEWWSVRPGQAADPEPSELTNVRAIQHSSRASMACSLLVAGGAWLQLRMYAAVTADYVGIGQFSLARTYFGIACTPLVLIGTQMLVRAPSGVGFGDPRARRRRIQGVATIVAALAASVALATLRIPHLHSMPLIGTVAAIPDVTAVIVATAMVLSTLNTLTQTVLILEGKNGQRLVLDAALAVSGVAAVLVMAVVRVPSALAIAFLSGYVVAVMLFLVLRSSPR
jgi:hypothetical protein